MLRVLVACGNNAGTSILIANKAEKTFKKLGIESTFTHASLNEAYQIAADYDLILTPRDLVKQFTLPQDSKTKIIGLTNVLSEAELVDKLRLFEVIR